MQNVELKSVVPFKVSFPIIWGIETFFTPQVALMKQIPLN